MPKSVSVLRHFCDDSATEEVEVDWSVIGQNLLQLAIAYALAFPIGWERERHAETAGLRTFPLVAVGACGYMLTGISSLPGSDPEAYSRLMYGLMTGIGFIGGGAILKVGKEAHGTATAASLWNVGAIGMAVAWRRYEIACLLSVLNFTALKATLPLKKAPRKERDAS